MPHLLFMCHGNVARSPAAEVIARHVTEPGSGWSVASAGVGALVGHPIEDTVASALRERGYRPGTHAARQVTPGMVREADLIVCMDAHQRQWLVDEVPAAAPHIVVFGQLERIAAHAPRRVVGLAHTVLHRGAARPTDDVADPFRRGPVAAVDAVARLESGIARFAPLLGLTTVRR